MSVEPLPTPWRAYTDPRGYFRPEMPGDWQVAPNEHVGDFVHNKHKQGHAWPGTRYITDLRPPRWPDEAGRYWGVTVRIDQYGEAPPDIWKGLPAEPTDPGFMSGYRVVHPSDNVSVATGHLRVWVQYVTAHIPGFYRPADCVFPPPLTEDERRERLAVIQRIFASFELLSDGTRAT